MSTSHFLVALAVGSNLRIDLLSVIFMRINLHLTLFCLTVWLRFECVDKDTNSIEIVCKSVEVVKIFRITCINSSQVVNGEPIPRPVQIFLSFPGNLEV